MGYSKVFKLLGGIFLFMGIASLTFLSLNALTEMDMYKDYSNEEY